MVGDGDAMRVARQIVQDVFRPSERFLRIDHPVVFFQSVEKRIECLAVLPALTGTVEGEPLTAKSVPQSIQELAAKDVAKNFHRQEKVRRGWNPTLPVARQPAAGHDTGEGRGTLQGL